MNGSSQGLPAPYPWEPHLLVPLSAGQIHLLKALHDKDPELAVLYLGAVLVFGQKQNPDSLSLTAHGMRELLERVPRLFGVKFPKGTQNDLVQRVRKAWDKWCRGSGGDLDSRLRGQNNESLRSLLDKVRGLAEWAEKFRSSRKEAIARAVKELDPLPLSLPKPIEELRVEEWLRYRDYFTEVAHHNIAADEEDVTAYMLRCEQFLLGQLAPPAFEKQDMIDRIVRRGEADAKR